MEAFTIRNVLINATTMLKQKDNDSARLDAEVLLAHIKECNRTDLYLKSNEILPANIVDTYMGLVQRRVLGEPIAYITGEKEFMSLNFIVNRHVLIPRPETELIIEEALKLKPLTAIDVGTGSGAISVSLAYYIPTCQVKAVDISLEALTVAGINATRNDVGDKLEFYEGNLLEPIIDNRIEGIDLITANLPYIPTLEVEKLPDTVRYFEPKLALDGGLDGLEYYYILAEQALKVLKPGGTLLLEIGYDQGQTLPNFLKNNGYKDIDVIKDYAGLDRIVKAQRL